jgi:hypothetical protein
VKIIGVLGHFEVGIFGARWAAQIIKAVEEDIAAAEEEVKIELHLGSFGGFVEFGSGGLIDGTELSDEGVGGGIGVGYREGVDGVEDVRSVVVVIQGLGLGEYGFAGDCQFVGELLGGKLEAVVTLWICGDEGQGPSGVFIQDELAEVAEPGDQFVAGEILVEGNRGIVDPEAVDIQSGGAGVDIVAV